MQHRFAQHPVGRDPIACQLLADGTEVREQVEATLVRVNHHACVSQPFLPVVAQRLGDAAREQLIPFVEPIRREVALAGGRITVDWEADY